MATSRVRVDSINEGASSLVRSYSISEGPPHGSARTQLTRGHPTGPHGSGPVSKIDATHVWLGLTEVGKSLGIGELQPRVHGHVKLLPKALPFNDVTLKSGNINRRQLHSRGNSRSALANSHLGDTTSARSVGIDRGQFFRALMLAPINPLLLCPMPRFHAIFPLPHLEPYPLACAIDALSNCPTWVQVLMDAFLP